MRSMALLWTRPPAVVGQCFGGVALEGGLKGLSKSSVLSSGYQPSL